MLCVQRLSDAGGQGQVLASKCPEAKTGQQKVHSITKTIHFAHIGILLIYGQISLNQSFPNLLLLQC